MFLEDGQLKIGVIDTYIELYARLSIDLTPHVVLAAGFKADGAGNRYTGASTQVRPALVEAATCRDGIVVAPGNEILIYGGATKLRRRVHYPPTRRVGANRFSSATSVRVSGRTQTVSPGYASRQTKPPMQVAGP